MTDHQNIVQRLNRDNRDHYDALGRKAALIFWLVVAIIVTMLIVRKDADASINEAHDKIAQQEFSAQQSTAILADLMNGRRYAVDGKVLSCKVQ